MYYDSPLIVKSLQLHGNKLARLVGVEVESHIGFIYGVCRNSSTRFLIYQLVRFICRPHTTHTHQFSQNCCDNIKEAPVELQLNDSSQTHTLLQLQLITMRIRKTSHHNTIAMNNKSPKSSCSLPLLPLSPLLALSSVRIQSRRERDHKKRSLSSMIHRRSQSSSCLFGSIPKITPAKHQDGRSTMSLCSVTSDEYENDDDDDTIMDSMDDCDDVPSTRDERSIMIHPVSSQQPAFPLFTRGNRSSMYPTHEMVEITPPTPTRLTLKMRPSSFTLPYLFDNALYTEYNVDVVDDRSDGACIHTIEEMSRDEDGNNGIGFATRLPNDDVPVTVVSTADSRSITIISDSVSYDENDDNENIVPPTSAPPPAPTTPLPFQYPNHPLAAHARMMRLQPKHVVQFPFHSHDNYNHVANEDHPTTTSTGSAFDDDDDDDDVRFTAASFRHHMMPRHLLLPDDL